MGAVLRREWLCFLSGMGRPGLVRFVAIYFVVFGFVLPGSLGNVTAAYVVFAFVPLYVAGPLAVDAFAGERERATLETLLTSPVTPGKLLGGKMLFPLLFGLFTAWSVMGLFTVWSVIKGWELPGIGLLVPVMAGGVFTAVLGSLTGLHVSLRARSVRSGQQWFSIALLAMVLGMPLFAKFLLPRLPSGVLVSVGELFRGGWSSAGVLLLEAGALIACAILGLALRARVGSLWVLNPGKRER
jgi:ABC-2 type transport system permease protein